MEKGLFVWLDLDVIDPQATRPGLTNLGLIDEDIIRNVLTGEPAMQ